MTDNMSVENVEILVDSQNFMEPPNKRKRNLGGKQKLIKKFQLTEEVVEYLLDLLKRYKVMCDFFGKDFDATKTVQ